MKHKHAELIKAWADGAEIEYLCHGEVWMEAKRPSWYEDTDYRIKTTTKPDVVTDVVATIGCISIYYAGLYNPNLKLTFDGETGKLKSAEVLE